MSFSADQTLDSARQLIRQACLYNKTTSYGYYAPITSHNLYDNGKVIDALQARKLTGTEQSLVSAAVYGHNGYQQNLLASNEITAFQFTPMAPIGTPQQPYCTDIQSWISPFQATTDYTGLMDATNPATRPKPAHPFYSRKRGNSVPTEGMTRTRDKYRVVYTEKQRVGLEKEFKTNKFITMQRKMEISKELDLSERQIKIWFQNRRAKERRQRRKTETIEDDMLNGDMLDPVTELQQNDPSKNVQPNDTLFHVDVTRHSYPSLQTLKDSSTKSQCRFQQSNSRICETGDVRETQEHQSITRIPTSPPDWNQVLSAHITSCTELPSEWRQTSAHLSSCNVSPPELRQANTQLISCNVSPVEWRHPSAQTLSCNVSPSEWRQTSAQMTSCNISPFSANPDWNLIYRT